MPAWWLSPNVYKTMWSATIGSLIERPMKQENIWPMSISHDSPQP